MPWYSVKNRDNFLLCDSKGKAAAVLK